MVLQNGTFEGRRIVAAEALLPAMRAEIISSLSRTAEARPSFYGYGMGVGITSSGRVSIDHSGAFALGAATTYRMIPALGLGIVVLTNSAPIGLPEALAAEFTDRVELGRSSRDWLAAYGQVMAGLMAPVGTLAGKTPPAAPQPAADAALYAGTFANAYFGPAEVSAVDGRLVLALGPQRRLLPLAHWDGPVFTFTPSGENAPDGSRAAVRFTQSGTAPATAFTIDILDGDGMGTFSR